jgi:hypothetical protein
VGVVLVLVVLAVGYEAVLVVVVVISGGVGCSGGSGVRFLVLR